MKTFFWVSIIIILLAAGVWYFNALKQEIYEDKLTHRNELVTIDSLRQVDSTKYSQLAYQYANLDSISSEILSKKDKEILALTELKAKVKIKTDTVYAAYEEADSMYIFSENDKYYKISGKVKVLEGKLVALVIIDSLVVPVELDIAFVGRKDDMIEVKVDVGNKYIVLDELTSYIKVSPSQEIDKFGKFAGVLIGPAYGVGAGIRYDRFYLLGTITQKYYNLGVFYDW